MNIAFAANIFYLFLFYANCKFVCVSKIFFLLPRGKNQTQLELRKAFNFQKPKKQNKKHSISKKQNIKKAPVAKLFIRSKLDIRSLPWGNVTYLHYDSRKFKQRRV